MRRLREPDLAGLYHLHSSNSKARMPNLTLNLDERPERFVLHPGAARQPLGGCDLPLGASLDELLAARRSLRDFDLAPLPAALLGRLLHASFGIHGYRDFEGERLADRPAPSAGGLYPLELYVAVRAVEGVAPGIHHYDPRNHELAALRAGAVHERLADLTIGQEMIRDAPVVIAVVGVLARTMWKYGQRGYRYVWLDAGHLAQNLLLVAGALGLGGVPIGGFYDREVDALLGLDGEQQRALYLLCVGQPAASRAA